MKAILFDFNGTLFFDSGFHLEAWSKIYRELRGNTNDEPGVSFYCGPRNDAIIQKIAPWLTKEERDRYSQKKEAFYRQICLENDEQLRLPSGAEELLDYLRGERIPFLLASASIKQNIDFYFQYFGLERWFDKEQCVYDDGSYSHKGEMHLEAARRLGVAITECIVIEDSVSAVSHAKDNGAGLIVGIGSEAAKSELIRIGANYFIHDFTEFNREWLTA